jgi:hypothetical protein
MDRVLHLEVLEEGLDAEQLATLANYLRAELLELDVDGVSQPEIGAAPPGTRGIGIAAVGALLVTLGQSVDAVQAVLATIGNWLSRGAGSPRSVKVTIDGDTVELSNATGAEQEALIALFASKHAG